MRKQIVLGYLLASVAICPPAWGEIIEGVVVGVTDGDTITVLDEQLRQYRVRLAGIDAPEKTQDFGRRSQQHLAVLAFARRVIVDGSKTDRYGRLVGKVIVSGNDINLRQIEAGLAWHYKPYEREQKPAERLAYGAAENAAKGLKKGLWSMPGAQPPWEFRRRRTTRPPDRLGIQDGAVVE